MVQPFLHKILLDLIRDEVKGMDLRSGATAVPAEALARFMTGALFGLLMWWLTAGTRLSVEDTNRIFRQLAIPAFRAAATWSHSTDCLRALTQNVGHVDTERGSKIVLMLLLLRDNFPDLFGKRIMTDRFGLFHSRAIRLDRFRFIV